ncbi:store-operated calcium entry-associated regulatory factor isoform X1 [Frankliniella occidentalis]|uniref:Store-operated calcium entry-associated regulatory factor n=1 Tax=Frankliniella occidentalis TaxID=133901 RepID=A0A6J1TC97_FRAOC|nr:store-operated calcium entry-associated regulatory factor isoform X1 [Frankliniella occidentalis]
MKMSKLFILVFTILVFAQTDWVKASKPDRILYKNLGTLYFYPGEITRSRRTLAVPQLVCLKGCQYPQPISVKCENVGWDGSSNLWRCTAELDSEYALDKPEVVCEGYSSPDDSYVTAGSCSLEYSIKRKGSSKSSFTSPIEPPGLSGVLFILFCMFLLYVLYITCVKPDTEAQQNRSYTNNDGPDDGRGPQMGWNIPGSNPRNRRNSPGFGFGNQPRDDTCGGNNYPAGGSGGGGPGFWTGLAAGGILGSMFGGGASSGSGYRNTQSSSPRRTSSGFSAPSSGFSAPSAPSSGWGESGSGSGSTSQSEATARYRQR